MKMQFDRLRFLFFAALATALVGSASSVEAQFFERLKQAISSGVSVSFQNNTRRALTLNSTTPGSQSRGFAQVGPGQTVTVSGIPGQTWTAVDANNRTVAQYQTTTQPRQSFTITQGQGQGRPQPQPQPQPQLQGNRNPAPGNQQGGARQPLLSLPFLPGGVQRPNQGGVAGVAPQSNPVNPRPKPANPQANAGTAAAPIGNTGSRLTQQQANQMVAYHNQKRAEVKSGRVTWSPQIAAYAQKRADDIARTRRFGHLPAGQNPYGENLARGGSTGAGPGYTVINACEGWYAEKAKMPAGARTMTVALFNRRVGHYTQMVWKGSTEIGAGVAHYQEGGFNMTVVVCCYNPRGNVINEAIY